MGKTKRTLLVDADVVCYRAAWRGRETLDWGDGEEPLSLLDFQKASEYIREFHDSVTPMGAPVVYCLSDREWNFRKDIFADYKANRDDRARPELLGHCLSYVKSHFRHLLYPSLEADDVMGLESKGAIMISIDKDLLTVPGLHYNPDHPEQGVFSVGRPEAAYRHLLQTLTGDSVDNYKGCPGIGPKKAEALLGSREDAPKGPKALREWVASRWPLIVEAYRGKDLSESDALLNARLAHILQPGEYCFETSGASLWTPPTAKEINAKKKSEAA